MWIRLLSVLLSLLGLSFSYSQTIIFENFESYEAGALLAQEAGNPWTTWNNEPGGIEDPVISNDTAFSDTNSVFVSDGNDCILLLGDKVNGKYRFDFRIFVHSGCTGYFSLLQEFNGNQSKTGVQMFFESNGNVRVDAEGVNIQTFSYTLNKWHHLRIFVDLDTDFASLFFNDEEIVNWQWSKGAFNQSNLLKLGAANFYGWNQQDTAGFYFDDIEFVQLDTMNAPQNLTGFSSNDTIYLNWNLPAGDSLTYYKIIRNGEILADNITNTTFTDANLYPKRYTYQVKAFYSDYGYSPVSNSITDTVQGGVERNYVLFETGTGNWCEYCTGVAMGIEDMLDSSRHIAIVNYHFIDDYQNDFGQDRLDYYSIIGYPITIINGIERFEGGNSSQSMYNTFNGFYENQINVPSLFTIELSDSLSGDTLYCLSVIVEEIYQHFEESLKLHAVFTQSHIEDSWFGQNEVNNVCIESLTDNSGTDLDFTASSIHTIQLIYNTDSIEIENFENYELVVFLQHENSKEILQVQKRD